jgi:PAP2 superfamily
MAMTHGRLGVLAAFAAAVAVGVPAVASANEVTKWNDIAVSTVNAQPPLTSAPPAGSIFVAMVQGAVYGAVNAADRRGRPYLVNRSFPMAAKDAAAAAAAFTVLDALFPAQHATLQAAYDTSLAGIPGGALKNNGVAVGVMAAEAMLAEGHDGRTVIGCTFGSGAAGAWQPLAGPTGMPLCDPTPWVGNAVPFIVKSPSQFRTAGPYPLGSAAYAADFNEVKAKGALNSATRTAEQTHAAAFWQTNPAANYNAMARRFVDQLSLDLSDSARLFALLDLSAADALITTWNDKYYWSFWRPMSAIRHADMDGNQATTADPTWTPLFDPSLDPAIGGAGPALITPPYPDHPSGATAYASASMHAFASFFGTDDMTFYATSSRFPGEQRTFHHFSDLTNEVLVARIWAGIHFRNPDVQAAALGRDVERYIHKHVFAAAH